MRKGLALAALVVLGACETALPPSIPPITFADRAKVSLAVDAIEVIDEYRPPFRRPNIEHEFPTPPATAVRTWAAERLIPAGGPDTLELVIRDASARLAPLPRTGGVRGLLTTDQAERIDLTVAIEIRIRNARGRTGATVAASAERRRTLAEGITLDERDRAYQELTRALMEDLDQELMRNIDTNFGRYKMPQ